MLQQRSESRGTGRFKAHRAGFVVTTLIALAVLIGARPLRAQEGRRAGERTEPAGRERAGTAAGAAASASQIDLVELANSLVDATGEFKVAKITFNAREKLKAAGVFNDVEHAQAQARMETAEKRLTVLRSLAQVALESAQARLERLEKLREQGVDSSALIEEATGRVKMLSVIVKAGE
jgi:hypothetical protein